VLALLLAVQFTVDETDPPFRLSIPAGYAIAQEKTARHAFRKQEIGLSLAILPGPLPATTIVDAPDLRSFKILPPGATYRVVRERWRDVDIDVSETRYDLLGAQTLVLVAAVPLLPRAISIRLHGPVVREEEMRTDLRRVLTTLEGRAGRMSSPLPELLAVTFVTGGVALLLLVAGGLARLFRLPLAEVTRITLLYSTAALFVLSGTCGVLVLPWVAAGAFPLGAATAILAVSRTVRVVRSRADSLTAGSSARP
jgi:hypothetical protein